MLLPCAGSTVYSALILLQSVHSGISADGHLHRMEACIHMYVYIYTHVYIYIYIYVYLTLRGRLASLVTGDGRMKT